jgi:protein-tyrosine phosphatase
VITLGRIIIFSLISVADDDLHCEYLPAVDDGALDMTAGLALARAAVANGIHAAVLTPNAYAGRWDNTLTGLRPHFREFRKAVEDAGIVLEVYLGAEAHLLPESLHLYVANELPALGAHRDQPGASSP